jgi:hypothetical protein
MEIMEIISLVCLVYVVIFMIMALIATAIGLWLLLQFAKRKLKKED